MQQNIRVCIRGQQVSEKKLEDVALRALARRLAHSAELGASFWVKRATKIANDLAKQGRS
jgi:hypothetical protein